MPICEIRPDQCSRILPLLHQVHDLHLQHQPVRYAPLPTDRDMCAYLQDWLSRHSVQALGFEADGALAGYAIYEIEERSSSPFRPPETRAIVHQISVDTAFRRQGVGTALMAEVKARLLAAGGTVVAASFAEFNCASAALMARCGLQPVMSMAEWRFGDP